MTQKNALVIICDGIEELEAVAAIDCLRRAGVDVTVASSGDSPAVTGRNRVRITADALLESCKEEYALLVIPGGPSHSTMAEDQRILQLLREQDRAGRLVGSICAGPVVLDRAGVLDGRRFTSFPGTKDALPARDPSSRVVRDGNLITSMGAGTATEFALALVEALCGEPVARDVGRSICFQD